MPCPNCAAPLVAGAKFCPECGTRVAVPTERGQARPEPPSGRTTRHERRQLTVLFADLVGFTAASDHADPEDVRARVRPFHALVREAVAGTRGTVARVVGDGVMAVWGYPIAREDDALRAVEAALRIRDGLPAAGRDLHARIGVNTGEAVVAFGSDDEDADDAMGDAVNVAARLATAATPDSILVGATTRTLTGEAMTYEDLEPVRLKGKAEPVPVARVVGRAVGAAERAQAEFVGREREISQLVSRLAGRDDPRLRRALVVGEPGIGKSRLIAEARMRLGHAARSWYTGRCRSDVSVPGLALGEVLKSWAGISDDDTPAGALERLDRALPPGVPDRSWLLDRVRPLVGAGTTDATSREETFVAWTRVLELLAGHRGAVILIEDVHWADEELALFLGSDALAAVNAPIALLLTGRPEVLARPEIANAARADTIILDSLDGDALDRLVASVGPDLGLGPGERAEIVRRAGGNPLFTLELLRLRAQQRAAGAADGDALPETVQAVIAARLDLLPLDARAVAQDAAVIGTAFWVGALQAIAARGPGLDAALDELQRLELISGQPESTLGGEPELAFRHALVREVAYGQLTRGDRATRHAAVARWLGVVAGDRLDLAGVIADHDLQALALFGAAGVDVPADLPGHALEHLLRAGRHAEAVDPRAAADRYQRAAEIASNARDRLRALFGLIRALDEQGAYAVELETIGAARDLARSLDDHLALGRLLVHASAAYRPIADQRWVDCAREALTILEALPPSVELVEALVQQSSVELASFEGTADGVVRAATRAIELSDQLGVPAPAMAHARRGFARAAGGHPDAIDDMRRARELAEAGPSGSALVRVISDSGGVQIYFGDLRGADLQLREAIEVARRRGLPGVLDHMETNLVYLHRALGRWDDALALALPSLVTPLPEERRFTLQVRASELAFILADRGDVDGVRRMIELLEPGPGATADAVDLIRSMARVNLGGLLGDVDLIVEGLAGVETRDGDVDFDGRSTTEYPALARAALSIGRADLIDRFIRSINAMAPLARTTRELLVGYRAAGLGEHEAAVEAFASSGEQLGAWGFEPEASHARHWRARSELALGREAEALAHLGEVRPVWVALGAAAPLADLDRLLQAQDVGRRTPR